MDRKQRSALELGVLVYVPIYITRSKLSGISNRDKVPTAQERTSVGHCEDLESCEIHRSYITCFFSRIIWTSHVGPVAATEQGTDEEPPDTRPPPLAFTCGGPGTQPRTLYHTIYVMYGRSIKPTGGATPDAPLIFCSSSSRRDVRPYVRLGLETRRGGDGFLVTFLAELVLVSGIGHARLGSNDVAKTNSENGELVILARGV